MFLLFYLFDLFDKIGEFVGGKIIDFLSKLMGV